MLTIATTGATMTSREIADLTGKQHQHVKRDIENMMDQLQEDKSSFGRIYLDTMNREQIEYALDREMTDILLTGYSAVLRRKVLARWRELEAAALPATPMSAVALPNFADPVAAARAWADAEEGKQKLQIELAAAAPAVEFVEKYVDSTGLKGFRQVAKLLRVKEPEFREFLIDEKILYRLGGEMVPFAAHIDAGRFCVKAGTAGTGHAFNSAKFTAKGIEWVAGELARWQLAQRAAGEVAA